MRARHDEAHQTEAKSGGEINQPIEPKHVTKRRERERVCRVAATHRRVYARVFFSGIIIPFIFRFRQRVASFRVARRGRVPVLFRSFVCQIFIERFGVAVNERERVRRPAGKKERKREKKRNQEHEWGGAATTEAIAEVFGSAIGDCIAK